MIKPYYGFTLWHIVVCCFISHIAMTQALADNQREFAPKTQPVMLYKDNMVLYDSPAERAKMIGVIFNIGEGDNGEINW